MYLVTHAAGRPEKCSQRAQRGGGKTFSVGSLCAARQCRGTWEMGAALQGLGGSGLSKWQLRDAAPKCEQQAAAFV